MKCEVCLELLDEYCDGELDERESSEVAAHLVTCANCAAESSALAVELEMFLQYDRELNVPSSMFARIAERTVEPATPSISHNGFNALLAGLFRIPSFGFTAATVAALIVLALLIGAVYIRTRTPGSEQKLATRINAPSSPSDQKQVAPQPVTSKQSQEEVVAQRIKPKTKRISNNKHLTIDQSEVVSADFGYQDSEDKDTAKHFEQTQNLLRSIRNVQVNDSDKDIDVTYDKALSRRLLNENVVLRRDAEMKAKFPTKSLLSDLEPLLIDIANLPDQAKPDDVRAIKERVQKTEIVAALIGYE